MANGFNTDYSFLNLPEAGSSAQGPIEAPSFDPTDFSFDSVDRFAPKNLPSVDTFAPSLPSLSADENEDVLNNARAFEDVRTLGATFGQKLAETERFFGERVSSLQGNIDDLINTKSDLTKQLEAAFLQQDEMSQQAIEEQIAALDAQRAELTAQLEQSVSEAEANGVDAVAASESVAAEKIANLDQQIAQTSQELQEALAQQDVIRAEESEKRLGELENQKVTLTDQFTQQQTALQEQFGQREAELTGTIDTLQGEINNLTGARDSAVAERDQALAQQDTIRAESADAQAQALDAQANNYQAQLDELTGQSTQYQGQVSERDQTIADLQAQIAELQNVPQPPADAPPPPPPTPPVNVPGGGGIDYGGRDGFISIDRMDRGREPKPDYITDIPLTAPIAMPRNPDMVKMIQDKMGQDQLFIDDGPINKDDFIASMPNEKPVPFIPKPPRNDFISYERIGKPNSRIDGIGGFLGKKLGRMGRR